MKGAYSNSSAWVQFLIILMLGLAGALVFSALGAAVAPLFYDVKLMDIFTDPLGVSKGSTGVLKLLQLFSSLGTFVVPALAAAFLFSNKPASYLAVKSFTKPLLVTGLVILVALCGNSVSDLLYRFSTAIPWPQSLEFLREALDSAEKAMGAQIQRFLEMESFWDFLGVFFIMAILPAVGEELLFRGVLQKVILKGSGNMHIAVWVTALLFGLLHQQVYAFLSITALGVVLGYLKEWSRSIVVPMILHLVNNGGIILAVYFFDVPYNNQEVLDKNLDWSMTLPMLAGFGVGLLVLHRIFHEKK